MFKVALIGAGSVVFIKNLLTDILDLPGAAGGDDLAARHRRRAPRDRGHDGPLDGRTSSAPTPGSRSTSDRRAALDGADFVINMVQIGMHEATLLDFEIPRKYGLKQTIADTLSIGGIFRGLRTIPFMLDLVGDMRRALPATPCCSTTPTR